MSAARTAERRSGEQVLENEPTILKAARLAISGSWFESVTVTDVGVARAARAHSRAAKANEHERQRTALETCLLASDDTMQ
jgi:hypothetical protein